MDELIVAFFLFVLFVVWCWRDTDSERLTNSELLGFLGKMILRNMGIAKVAQSEKN